MTPDIAQHLADARDEEVRRGRELLQAAQQRYDGAITQDEMDGYVCRYGHAVLTRRVLAHEANIARANNLNLN
jgi:hypothetical protein